MNMIYKMKQNIGFQSVLSSLLESESIALMCLVPFLITLSRM